MTEIRKKCVDSTGPALEAYFTVEAALVLPIVFACYLFVALIMCFIYERCVLEQNACRLSVWMEYVDGYEKLSGEMSGESKTELTEQDLCTYLLQCLEEEEKPSFLFAGDKKAVLEVSDNGISVERSFVYPALGSVGHEIKCWAQRVKAAEVLRTVRLLRNIVSKEEKEEEND